MQEPVEDKSVRPVFSENLYHEFIRPVVLKARESLLIATADIKDMHVEYRGRFVSIAEVFATLVRRNVSVQLMHAKEPGPRFRKSFDRFKELYTGSLFERMLCPRLHMKTVIVDQKIAYVGSANLTGAGMGAKHKDSRNFEAGFITEDSAVINELTDYLDAIADGVHCGDCRLRDVCPDPLG